MEGVKSKLVCGWWKVSSEENGIFGDGMKLHIEMVEG